MFIQTDKAVYKPGDKVQFRVLVVNSETKPVVPTNVQIFISDADSNRIKQYENVEIEKGVYKDEFQLSDEPVLGNWKIEVKVDNGERNEVVYFSVDEYVLPVFDVTINTKSKITVDNDIVVTYSAKYTYGKEADGTAEITAELSNYWWWGNPAAKVVKLLDNSTKTTTISVRDDLNIDSVSWARDILITVTFTEALTGKQRTATTTVTVVENPFTITITGSDDYIKPNIPFDVTTVVDALGVPVTDSIVPITFTVTYTYDSYDDSHYYYWWWWRPLKTEDVTFEKFLRNGITDLQLNITANITSINIQGFYKGAYGYLYIYTAPSESNQYIDIKVPSNPLSVSDKIPMEVTSNVVINNVNYILSARNKIVKSGKIYSIDGKYFKIILNPTPEMVPEAVLVAFYVASNGEIISDRKLLQFNTELRNFVSTF